MGSGKVVKRKVTTERTNRFNLGTTSNTNDKGQYTKETSSGEISKRETRLSVLSEVYDSSATSSCGVNNDDFILTDNRWIKYSI